MFQQQYLPVVLVALSSVCTVFVFADVGGEAVRSIFSLSVDGVRDFPLTMSWHISSNGC